MMLMKRTRMTTSESEQFYKVRECVYVRACVRVRERERESERVSIL